MAEFDLSEKLREIRARTEKFRLDLKSAKFSIKEHCDSVRQEVDLKAESLIREINEHRDKLFKTIEKYEKCTLRKFDTEFDSTKFDEFVKYSNEMTSKYAKIVKIENDVNNNKSEIETKLSSLSNELNQMEKKFKMQKYDNEMIDFECCMQDSVEDNFGWIYYKTFCNERIQSRKSSTLIKSGFMYDLKFCQLLPMSSADNNYDKWKHFVRIDSDKFMFIEFYDHRDIRVALLSEDLMHCEKLVCFKNFLVLSYETDGKEMSLDSCVIGDSVLFSYYTPDASLIHIFDKSLNKSSHYTSVECLKKVTANKANIYTLNQSDSQIQVFDWHLDDLESIENFDFGSKILDFIVDNDERFVFLFENSIRIMRKNDHQENYNETYESFSLLKHLNLDSYVRLRMASLTFYDEDTFFILDKWERVGYFVDAITGWIKKAVPISVKFNPHYTKIVQVNEDQIQLFDGKEFKFYFYNF